MIEREVRTPTGTYVGFCEDSIREFLGIRYVEPVSFWEFPQPLTTTPGDRIEAKTYGPQCLQPTSPDELASLGEKSNDCLTLNIWTKDNDNTGKPVMVYIHGGSYSNGGNADPITCGKGFLELLPDDEDAVMVKINYRVGIFGCADLTVLEGDTSQFHDTLALHIVDQIAALRWVHENISAFGGDPDNVTLFGQSAGSMSIAYLMANEEARNYFSRGIMQSGIPGFGLATKEAKATTCKGLFDALGIRTIDELMSKDDDFWNEHYDKVFMQFAGGICPRVIDGKYIKDTMYDEIKNGNARDISLMVGGTTGEMDVYKYSMMDPSHINTADEVLDMLYAMNEECGNSICQMTPYGHDEIHEEYINAGEDSLRRACNIFSAYATQLGSVYYAEWQSKWNNTYHYAWNWMPDATKLSKTGQKTSFSSWGRALHCAELPVLFNSGDVAYPALGTWWVFYLGEDIKETVPKSIVPVDLARKAALTWYSFAKTGNPNNELIPEWKPFDEEDRATMFIDEEWDLRSDALIEDRNLLRGIEFAKRQDNTLKNTRKVAMNVHAMER